MSQLSFMEMIKQVWKAMGWSSSPLREYTGNGIVRGVAFKYDGKGGVEVVEDGDGGKGFFEEGEDTSSFFVPVPWGVLSCETVEEFGDLRVVIKELAIEVGKTKKKLHTFYVPGWRPIEDGLHLSRVHAKSVQGDNDTEVLNFDGVK
ncbi:hypothetical protein C0993_007793 [Termitomyces sp. T159_Od127]|nr:hypothetical protein C0993_007793 [Termitomyces sp. T159_Od127]